MREWRTFNGIGGEEGQVLGLERVVVGELGVAALRLRLAGQRRVVHLEPARLDDADIGRDAVAEFHFDDVSDADLLGLHRLLEALAHHDGVLRHHVLEGFHDFVAFALLVVREDARHHHDGRQHRTEVQLNHHQQQQQQQSLVISSHHLQTRHHLQDPSHPSHPNPSV